MGEDGSLVIEPARACLGREGEALASALVKDDDGVIWAGGKNKAGSGTRTCWSWD